MYSQKIVGALTVIALLAATQGSAEAQYYSGGYTTFYAPSTSYYNEGYTSYYGGGGSPGYGYTSYYGGSPGYGGNPFAPLVASPYRYGWGGWFGSGYTAAYGPSGYGYGGGCCSPCGGGCGVGCSGGGCATGNCSVPASSEQMKPSPDNGVPMEEDYDPMPRTFDDGSERVPMDSEGFRRSGTENEGTGTDSFPGGVESNESFKIPMNLNELDETDLPQEKSPPIDPLDADKPSVPDVLYVPTTKPITPRNSARVEPASHLDRRITWRSQPVIVPERAESTASRPLIVRKTVRVQLNAAPTLVSRTNSDR